MKIVSISMLERTGLKHVSGLPEFDAKQLLEHQPDAHLCVLTRGGTVAAHCSVWRQEAPRLANHITGAIGHYASADEESGAALLEGAAGWLREHGCTCAIGPMDGNTWRRYRFVVGHGGDEGRPEPPFFLEPENHPDWPRQFEGAGFRTLAEYHSAINADLSRDDPRAEAALAVLARADVQVRTGASADLRAELKRIYRVSCAAFAGGPLYTPLPETSFLAQYERLLPWVRPELLLLAEREGELAGFLFAIPNVGQAGGRPRPSTDTFLIKTVAALPDPGLRGVGGALVALSQAVGCRLGYRRCIHALMREENISCNISRHYAVPMRRYRLYRREIAA